MDAGVSRKSRAKWSNASVVALALAAVFAGASVSFFALSAVTTPALPGPAVPPAPRDLTATAEDASLLFSWDSVAGATQYNLYLASSPGVSKENYATLPDGARFAGVASPYAVTGLANGLTYYARLTAVNSAGESDVSAEVSSTPTSTALPPPPLYVTGSVEFDNGEAVPGAMVTVRAEDSTDTFSGITGGDGRYTVRVTPAFPTRVLVTVSSHRPSEPTVTGFRWSPVQTGEGAVDVGRIVLPTPDGKQLGVAGKDATSADGHIVLADLPPEVDTLWAKDYEPDLDPDTFPGELAEGRLEPINSITFLWISALSDDGGQIFDLSAPATVRLRVFPTQWVDLEDLQPGNGVIDTPIYSLEYATGYWVREPDGVLTDAGGTVLPESEEAAIRQGQHPDPVYAEFQADHFSWWNIDKPPSDCRDGGIPTDFGDAPDLPYRSTLARDGVRHLSLCRAWLGAWADGETDASAVDFYDDGVQSTDPLVVSVSNWDWLSSLYLNILVDANDDGDFEDPGEWILQNLEVVLAERRGKTVETEVGWDQEHWMRVTLAGAPISAYTGQGEQEIGETEDYAFLPRSLRATVYGNGTVTSDPLGVDCRWRALSGCFTEFRSGATVTLTAAPDPGESFLGWGGDCASHGTSPTCSLVLDQDRFVDAAFTQSFYELRVAVSGDGTVTSVPPGIDCRFGNSPGTGGKICSALFPEGSSVVLAAMADPGESFVYWANDCAAAVGPTCTLVMDRNRNVYAQFTRAPYLYVYDDFNQTGGNGQVVSFPPGINCWFPNPGGSNRTCSAQFERGALVTLVAYPDPGWRFDNWSGDAASCGTTSICALLMDGDRWVSASFLPGSPGSDPLVRIEIQPWPGPVFLDPGTSASFTARGFGASGNLNTSWMPLWGTTDGRGTVGNLGGNAVSGWTAEYTATAPGNDTLTVGAFGLPSVSNATNVVVQTSGPLARLELIPVPSVTLEIPDTQVFTARAYDALGNLNVTWTPTWSLTEAIGRLVSFGEPAPGTHEATFRAAALGTAELAVEDPATGARAITAVRVVDLTPPISQIDPLPATSMNRVVSLTYTAADSGGSGLRNVEIWVRTADGPFEPLADAAASPMTFTAPADGEYFFYSVAADRAGNSESPPRSYDATVRIDTVAPAVPGVDDAAKIDANAPIVIHFSEPMDRASTEAAIEVAVNAQSVQGTWTWAGNNALFTPDQPFSAGSVVVVTLAAEGARDASGNPLPADVTMQFTVGSDSRTSAPFPMAWPLLLVSLVFLALAAYLRRRKDKEDTSETLEPQTERKSD